MIYYKKQDLKLEFEDDMFHQYFLTHGVDLRLTNSWETLWQTVTNELLTPFGEVQSERFSNYGSYLHYLIGEKITTFMKNEVKLYVSMVLENYDIESWSVNTIIARKQAGFSFNLTIFKDGESESRVINVG